jgi:AhpC/TSA family
VVVRDGAAVAWAVLALSLAGPSCAARAGSPAVTPAIVDPGDLRDLRGEGGGAASGARLTVLVFFSRHCHCLDAHEPRLRALALAYGPRGVAFSMIDSETGATVERDAAEARARGYPFPILVDGGARLAGRLGARYATYAVVLDAGGRVRYRGGIDTDKTHLTDDATPYLENALDDLLAGRAPRVAEGKALGCALRTW